MQLSVVTTLYQSQHHLSEFHARISNAAQQITDEYEILYVNDGSPDRSLTAARQLCDSDPHVRVIDLSRNFGHHRAILAGLQRAHGDLVFLIDSDLEEPPELLIEFWNRIRDESADVIYGFQSQRHRGWIDHIAGEIYYSAYSYLSGLSIPRNMLTVRLMSRDFVDALMQFEEREFVLSGLWALTGFHQIGVPVQKSFKGTTNYSLWHKTAILVDSLTSFSARPLVAIFYLGSIIALLAAAGGMYLIIRRLFFSEMLAGWPSIMVSIFFLGGLNLLGIGVVGIYLAKVFSEVKQRPRSIVRAEYGQSNKIRPDIGTRIPEHTT